MDVGRIRQIAADIRMAAKFDMSRFWFATRTSTECGTPGCIAGFVCARYLEPDVVVKLVEQEATNIGESDSTDKIAQKMLKLTDNQAWDLFWLDADDTIRATPKVAAATLEHLADTGEVEWQWGAK